MLNKFVESEKLVSELKEKSKSFFIHSSQIFNIASFKIFWRIFTSDKINLSSLPLSTKIKFYKELKKIKTRSENSAWNFICFLTVPLTCIISHLIYKNFQNEIRNKNKFFYRHTIKIPILIMIPSYFLSKYLFTIFYIRQPLIDLNEIFSNVDSEKVNKNFDIRYLLLKLGSSDKIINDREEYNKMIKYLYIEDKNKESHSINKIKISFPKFYLFSYEFTIIKLKFLILKEILAARSYINSINRFDLSFRISYLIL